MVRSNLPYVEHDVCTKRSTCPDDSYDRAMHLFPTPHFGFLLAFCQFQLRHRVRVRTNPRCIDGPKRRKRR